MGATPALPCTTGGHVPKRQAEGIVSEVAQDFEAFYQTREITVSEDTSDPLILSLDGKGIVMRREALREATRKAAGRESKKARGAVAPVVMGHRPRASPLHRQAGLGAVEGLDWDFSSTQGADCRVEIYGDRVMPLGNRNCLG